MELDSRWLIVFGSRQVQNFDGVAIIIQQGLLTGWGGRGCDRN
jgi:hypothetical protein